MKYQSLAAYIRDRGFSRSVDEKMTEAWGSVLEEMADVKLMMLQMEYMYGDAFNPLFLKKVDRAEKRIKEEWLK